MVHRGDWTFTIPTIVNRSGVKTNRSMDLPILKEPCPRVQIVFPHRVRQRWNVVNIADVTVNVRSAWVTLLVSRHRAFSAGFIFCSMWRVRHTPLLSSNSSVNTLSLNKLPFGFSFFIVMLCFIFLNWLAFWRSHMCVCVCIPLELEISTCLLFFFKYFCTAGPQTDGWI